MISRKWRLISLALVFAAAPAFAIPNPLGPLNPFKHKDKTMKGYELYSWKDERDHWAFALLLGTNRVKSLKEIKDKKNRISSVKALKRRLASLPKGEDVFWFHMDIPSLRYPDEATKADIALAAKKDGLSFHAPE